MLSNQQIRLCHSLLSFRTKYIANCSYIHHNISINVNYDNRKLCGKQFKQSVGGLTSMKTVNHNFGTNIKGCSLLVTRGYCTLNMALATYDEIKDLPNHPEKLLIDVREQNEIQETGQIPTSINIPLSQVRAALSDETTPEQFEKLYGHAKPGKDEPIIVSCRSGRRSDQAFSIVTELVGELEKELQLDPNEFKAKYGRDKPTPATEIIFHCKLGGRAGKATDFATRVGFHNAKNYKGSWLEWAEKEGLPK